MPTYTDTPCGRCIRDAERDLGPLTEGQKVDLLLDNFIEILDSAEARVMVRSVTLSCPNGMEHQNCNRNDCQCDCHVTAGWKAATNG